MKGVSGTFYFGNRMHGRSGKRSKYVQKVYKDTRELSVPLGWLG